MRFFTKSYHSLYHPLVYVSFAMDYAVTDSMNPSIFHATNFILHIFNSLLVLLLIYLISKNIYLSFFTAILFSVHPMHVEPVAWISERKEVLCAFFYLLSFVFYVFYKTEKKNKKLFYTSAVIFFLCALFSKAMAVTLPLVLVLYDYVFAGKAPSKTAAAICCDASGKSCGKPQDAGDGGFFGVISRAFLRVRCMLKILFFAVSFSKEKIIFFLLAAVFIFIGVKSAVPLADGDFFISVIQNIYRGAFQYFFYIVKLVLPFKLSVVYPPAMESKIVYKILTPLFVVFWGLLTAAAFKYSKKVFFGIAFYTITILPVLNIIPFGLEIPADRFTYIPYLGLFYAIAVFLNSAGVQKIKKTVVIIFCFTVLFFCFLSKTRVGEWENNVMLFTKAIERYPVYVAYTNRGAAYLDSKDYELALADEFKALETGSSYEAVAHLLTAFIYKETGKYDKALEAIDMALESASDEDAANVYLAKSEIYRLMGQNDKAVEVLNELYDNYENTNYIFWSTAEIYEKEGKYHLAALEMDKLLELEPHNEYAEKYRKKLLLEFLENPPNQSDFEKITDAI